MTFLPTISIIVPSFNQGRYVEQTILSVLRQDYPSIELIVADGGSTDETIDILRRYDKVVWFSEPDKGFSDAVNKGLRRATGEICAIQSSDDVYMPNVFRVVAEAFSDVRLNIVTGGMVFIDGDNRVLEDHYVLNIRKFDYSCFLRGEYYIPQPSTFFRRQTLEQVGCMNADRNAGADTDLWVRILKAGPQRIKYYNLPLSFYRSHDAQMTQTPKKAREFADSFRETLHQNFPPEDPFYEDALRGAYNISCHFLRQGTLRGALTWELMSLLFHRPLFFFDRRFREYAYTLCPRVRRVVEAVFCRLFNKQLVIVPDYSLPKDAFNMEGLDPNWMYH